LSSRNVAARFITSVSYMMHSRFIEIVTRSVSEGCYS
ncbi:MAG: hypothetical protein ACI8P0_004644, partial [Planctomycetaceae bacterium]